MLEKIMNTLGYYKQPKLSSLVPARNRKHLMALCMKALNRDTTYAHDQFDKALMKLPFANGREIHVVITETNILMREGTEKEWGKGYRWVRTNAAIKR